MRGKLDDRYASYVRPSKKKNTWLYSEEGEGASWLDGLTRTAPRLGGLTEIHRCPTRDDQRVHVATNLERGQVLTHGRQRAATV